MEAETSSAAMAAGTETFAFPTEINQLLTLVTTTFHSNKEIFFRELITNATDALEKIRLERLTDQSEFDATRYLGIDIIPDKVSNTLTIVDNGVGMTKSELVNNLGRPGTKSARADVSMAGFGFYSVFLVAKRVVVTTMRHQGQQYVWESEGGGSFTVRKGEASTGRGTKITLFLKEDQLEYLDEHRLKDLVEKYSESIYPISVWPEETIRNFSSDADADSWIRGVLSASEYRRLFFGYDQLFILYTVRGVPPYNRLRAVKYLLHRLDGLEQGLQRISPLRGGYTVPEGSGYDEGHVQ